MSVRHHANIHVRLLNLLSSDVFPGVKVVKMRWTSLEELTASPEPPSWIEGRGRGGIKGEGRGKEAEVRREQEGSGKVRERRVGK